jgi:hypothetical protein
MDGNSFSQHEEPILEESEQIEKDESEYFSKILPKMRSHIMLLRHCVNQEPKKAILLARYLITNPHKKKHENTIEKLESFGILFVINYFRFPGPEFLPNTDSSFVIFNSKFNTMLEKLQCKIISDLP